MGSPGFPQIPRVQGFATKSDELCARNLDPMPAGCYSIRSMAFIQFHAISLFSTVFGGVFFRDEFGRTVRLK